MRVGGDRDIPAKAVEAPELYRDALKKGVYEFQTILRNLRNERAAQIDRSLEDVLERLINLEGEYFTQLDLKFEAVEGETSLRKRSREVRLEKQKNEISQRFAEWAQWVKATREMVDDTNPYVDVSAVFLG